MNYIIGANSRLSKALTRALPANEVFTLNRADYAEWWQNGADEKITFFFEALQKKSPNKSSVLFIPAGLLDPRLPLENHHRVNYLLPKHLIQGASKLGIKVVTFGTIMEKIADPYTDNPYILSKRNLSEFIGNLAYPCLHLRIHTLYGEGLPSSFMFLGQLLDALHNHTAFKMSLGNQLREYHHLEDEINAIMMLLTSNATGVIELNHGDPFTLKEIAQYVFRKFDCLEQLELGALPSPEKESFIAFDRPSFLSNASFRNTLPAIVHYLRACKALRESSCMN